MLSLWLREHLVCPRDYGAVREDGNSLVCSLGHQYPLVDGIPIMLLGESRQADSFCRRTLEEVENPTPPCAEYVHLDTQADGIDRYVRESIVRGAGRMYKPLLNKLARYPIPACPLPPSRGETLLDIGCDWGRWSTAAARQGYHVIGLDPSLQAIRAARRVAAQHGVTAEYLVASANHLPFSAGSFGVVFANAVLQHFARDVAITTLGEIGRTLKPSGICLVQMAHRYGVRNLITQLVSRFRPPGFFGVRFWDIRELTEAFSRCLGPTTITAQGFFVLNAPPADLGILPRRYRLLMRASSLMISASHRLPKLVYLADSVWVRSVATRVEPGSVEGADPSQA